MKEFNLKNSMDGDIPKQLARIFKTEWTSEWGEYFLSFDNEMGSGNIDSMVFNWGVTLFRYKFNFKEKIKLSFTYETEVPINFLFLTAGTIDFEVEDEPNTTLKNHQNIIVYFQPHETISYIFPANEAVELNLIEILPKDYLSKKNHNISTLKESLREIFNNKYKKRLYSHFGNYNLRIADYIHEMDRCPYDGIVRTLILEGYLNIILGLQVLEHENYLNQTTLPDSLSQKDIEKIQKATQILMNSTDAAISVSELSKQIDLSPNKMQLGFKLMYSKTVNEYIRENKLEKAREYLRTTDWSVSEIVYNIGYKSRSYFSKIFNERYGMLPTEYRKNFK